MLYFTKSKVKRGVNMSFGAKLKELRINKKMKQSELVNLLNLSPSTISLYESDSRKPTPEIITKVADIFHVSTDYLLGISSSKRKYYDLNSKDEKDIQETLENLIAELDNGLYSKNMEEYDQESRDLLINALSMGLSIAKKEAKRKFTPKKYRD